MARTKHCEFCWAWYQNTECIAPAENRKELCKKAMERSKAAVKKPVKQKTGREDVGLKSYLLYIHQRVEFLKALSVNRDSNEYKYYLALQESIKQWGKSHAIFYGCIYGKIKVKQAADMCGVSKRTFFRMMSKQRKDLIDFIEEQECIWGEKYPFVACDIKTLF